MHNHNKGFTLLEVLIVVIIIGILAAIALPQYTATLEKGRSGEAVVNVGSIRTALDRYWYQNATYTTDFAQLDIDNPNNITNKLYTYTITEGGTDSYVVQAERSTNSNTWVKWSQTNSVTGKLTRSSNLGGPTI